MFVSPTRVCVIYVVKEVTSFPGAWSINGRGAKRNAPLISTHQQKESCVAYIDTGTMYIDGNPNPTSIWIKNNSEVTDGGRFDTSVPGQLTITTVISSDTGNYTNTLTNGVLISINNTIELIEYGKFYIHLDN